ncbi:MAG: hypothetical protein J6Y85_00395 [Alphaproteobacteria bacterium]|nr:hypothetical protein [Alphaproteobacteria bacterium]
MKKNEIQPERDINGLFIIYKNTQQKTSYHFYRIQNGLYFELDLSRPLREGLMYAWEAAKQQGCPVYYNTCSVGIVQVTPEMHRLDALNTLTAQFLSKMKIEPAQEDIRGKHAQQIAFSDFYFPKKAEFKSKAIINFCAKHGILACALGSYYDTAAQYMKSHKIPYQHASEVLTLFELPSCITSENLLELKQKLVLSSNDPRVIEAGRRDNGYLNLAQICHNQNHDIS